MTTHVTRQQIWKDISGESKDKEAELAGTYEMPHSKAKPERTKVASSIDPEDDALAAAFGTSSFEDSSESTEQFGKTAAMRPHIDVSGLEQEGQLIMPMAQRYALPDERMYPLDDYGQVKQASAYFDEHHAAFPPEVRRTYCQNMVKRAHELDIPVSNLAEDYASSSFGSPALVKVALDMRRSIILDEDHLAILDKLAEAAHVVEPEQFAETLAQFDKMACIEHHYGSELLDPYLSTFSKTATALSATDENESVLISNEYTSMKNIVELAQRKQKVVAERFGEDFAKSFAKEPKTIFNSMPRDEKLVLMRMANSSVDSLRNAST